MSVVVAGLVERAPDLVVQRAVGAVEAGDGSVQESRVYSGRNARNRAVAGICDRVYYILSIFSKR